MSFFKRSADDEDPRVPGGAGTVDQSRLKAVAEGSLFTSGLSVKEFALLDRLGPRPLAQVMGVSVIRPGWQYLPALPPGQGYGAWADSQTNVGRWYAPNVSGASLTNPFSEASFSQVRSYKWHSEVVCELDVLTQAWNTARWQALARLRDEAQQVKADAVVGVHLRHSDYDLGARKIEYIVSGTAIRLPQALEDPVPTLTDLSVQDYWRLLKAGHDPVGLLAATAVVFASPSQSTRLRRARTLAQNQELTEISSAFTLAREQARASLRGQLADAHATTAVGVEFSHSVREEKLALASSLQSGIRRGWHLGRLGIPYFVSGHSDTERRGWVITMHAAGTAVRTRQPSRPEIKTTVRMEG